MTKNDPFAQVFRDSPRFELPPASNAGSGAVMGADPFAQVFHDAPRFEAPHDLIFDSDGDGFIDPWDCQPFNPEEDGFWGDVWKSVTSRVKRTTSRVKRATRVDYGRAAARRSSVRRTVRRTASRVSGRAASTRRAVTRRIAPVTRRVRTAVARAPVHVSRERAADRRESVTRAVSVRAAPVTAAVRAAVARAPIHISRERAAERRATVVSGISAAAAPVTAAVRTAVARAPIHVSRERAADRRAALSPYRVGESLVGGATAWAARMSPIGIAAAAPGEPDKGDVRQRMIAAGVLPDRPTTLTTGVGGVPGQPDRAGDVHAYVGMPTTPPGSRGEGARGAGEGAPGEAAGFWGQLSEKIPTLYDIADSGAPFRERHKAKIDVVRGGYEKYSPKFAKEVIYPFAGGYAVGQYEELQKHPAKFVATTALFAVLPFALKGVGKAAKVVGAAKAVGKVPVVGKPLVAYGPKAALTGVGALWAGSAGYRIHEAPTIEAKGRVAGEIMASEALPLAVAAGLPSVAAVTPTIVRAPGYKGIGIKGFKKPIKEIVEVPAVQRGGVYEADLLAKPPTAMKEIITGYARQPKPLMGIRTGKFTTPEGVTTTWKGVQVGKGWTPAEITKTIKMESVTGAEGTALAMEKLTQARLGQFRYEHAGFARGKIDPGYFLPKGRTPSEGLLRLTTAEKGLVPVRDAPDIRLLAEGVPKPTRFYAEVKQPYMKAVDAPLAGSPAHIRWVEAGFRKVSYGVKGAPGVKGGKQVRFEVEAEPWGTHPSTQTAIGQTRAVVPYQSPVGVPIRPATSMVVRPTTTFIPADIGGGILPSAPPVRQIPRSMYFHPAGAPSSRFHDVAHAARPAAPPPSAPAVPARPRTMAEMLARTRPPGTRPPPIIESAASAKQGGTFAEPTKPAVLDTILGDMTAPEVLQTGKSCPLFDPYRAPPPSAPAVPATPELAGTPPIIGSAPRARRGVMVAEPTKSAVLDTILGDMTAAEVPRTGKSSVLDAILGDVKVAEPTAPVVPARPRTAAEVLQTGASCPIFAPARTPSRPAVSTAVTAPAKEGWWSPEARPAPGAAPTRPRTISEMLARTRKPTPEPRRRPVKLPRLEGTRPIGVDTPAPITEFKTEPVVKDEEKRRPIPLPHPATADVVPPPTTTFPEPITATTPTPPPPDGGATSIPPPPPPPPPVVTPPPTPTPPPPPPPVVTLHYPFGDSATAAAPAPRRRRAHEWELKHEMMTLEGFLGGVAKPATGAFPEPDLASPVAAKAGGGRARRPGLLDVPEGW